MKQSEPKKPIAFVVATVHFPLYERDHHESHRGPWDGFEYSEIRVGRRPCTTVQTQIVSPEELNP